MAVNGNDACYVIAFFAILVLSMQHSSCIACILLYWPSPGTVTCLLFSLHVCQASTVTAAFRDIFVFSGLAAYANGAHYVIAFFLAHY